MKDSVKTFTHYNAETHLEAFMTSHSSAHLYRFLLDGTTDAGNVEDQLVVMLCCGKDDVVGVIKSCARYFPFEVPKKADATGLITCFGNALKHLGVDDVLSKSSGLWEERKQFLLLSSYW